MIDFGSYCLVGAALVCIYGLVAGALGGRSANQALVRSAENAVVGNFILIAAASVALWSLLLSDDFSVRYVASYSAAAMPTHFKLTAFWGGQKGSLLLWTLILSSFSLVAILQNRNRNRSLMPWVASILSGVLFFFVLLLNLVTNPFETLAVAPPDGNGLNPLLQNWYMIIHPPTLFLGYIGVTIPFAFAMAALIAGRTDTSWVPTTRRWTMVAWIFLTCGLTLGARWAYEELGWGGYWAWDPVENASLMPWLVTTAFLHSIMITEKKGMLKTWNFLLVILAFELSIFGTFITRSGVVSSVHSFALSNIGPFFVVFLGLSTFFSLYWLFRRGAELRGEQRMQSFLSREASFLLNNWLFISICFAVFWGTIFPILTEAVQGEKISVAAPWFNRVNWPLGLALLVLTGICPLIAWRKASWKNFTRNFVYPLATGAVTGFILLAAGMRHAIALAFFSAAAFVMATIVFEFYKGARARQTIRPTNLVRALSDLTLMNKRRYGGYIVHAGMVLVFVGIVASSFFAVDEIFSLREGESFEISGYRFTQNGLFERSDPEKDVVFARLDIWRGENAIGSLYPQKDFHHAAQEQVATEVDIRSTFKEDLYLVLSGWDRTGLVTFHVFVNPLVRLVWLGVLVMAAGGFFVLLPNRKLVALRSAATAPQPEGVQHEVV